MNYRLQTLSCVSQIQQNSRQFSKSGLSRNVPGYSVRLALVRYSYDCQGGTGAVTTREALSKVALPAVLIVSALATDSQTRTKAGWRELFDGHSLQGWRHVGPGSFSVQKGLLVSSGGMGLLYWA